MILELVAVMVRLILFKKAGQGSGNGSVLKSGLRWLMLAMVDCSYVSARV